MNGSSAIAGVLLVGAVAVSIASDGKSALSQTTRTPAAAAKARLGDREFAFRLDGERLGRVIRMNLKRDKVGEPISGTLLVELDRTRWVRLVEDCDLVPERGGDDLGLDHGFRCAEPDESDLTEVGTVRFQPSGLVRPLKVRDRDLRHLSRGDAFDLSMDLDETVHLRGRGEDGSRFNIAADEDGAAIRVDGADGERVRLSADSNGAFITVRDKDGRELFRLTAGHHGLSIRGQEVRED